jgi:hypothetical protein
LSIISAVRAPHWIGCPIWRGTAARRGRGVSAATTMRAPSLTRAHGTAALALNAVMELTKYITSVSSTGGKRFVLAILSIVGVVAYSALNGTPLDVNSVSSLSQTALESALLFFASHGTYSLLMGKTAVPDLPNS